MNPRKKPKFLRSSAHAYKRIGMKWRKPRGVHSKLRRKEKGKGFHPNPGWGSPKNLKGLHPSGLKEVFVSNIKDMLKINPEKDAARISHTIGKKKRIVILKEAEEKKIRVLNK
ncbi:MAG: 50S ribosomal protein L32e [Candidatus Aenigmatarchaeota archaeon]